MMDKDIPENDADIHPFFPHRLGVDPVGAFQVLQNRLRFVVVDGHRHGEHAIILENVVEFDLALVPDLERPHAPTLPAARKHRPAGRQILHVGVIQERRVDGRTAEILEPVRLREVP